MDLFKPVPPIVGPIKPQHSQFEFLEGSAFEEVAAARKRIEALFQEYPTVHQENLKSRLASGDDILFSSALFELQFFKVLGTLGASKVLIEPSIEEIDGTPDYFAEINGLPYIIELAEVRKLDTLEEGHSKLRDEIVSRIRQIQSDAVFAHIIDFPKLSSLSGIKKVIKALKSLLDAKKYKLLHPYTFACDGFEMELEFIQRETGKLGSLYGAESHGASWSQTTHRIRQKIKTKASKYKTSEIAYLIALNVHDFTFKPHDGVEALFGTDAVRVIYNEKTGEYLGHKPDRANDGQIFRDGKYHHLSVDGFLMFQNLNAYEVNRRVHFYPHPSSAFDLSPWELFPSTRVVDEKLESSSGSLTLAQCFL